MLTAYITLVTVAFFASLVAAVATSVGSMGA
jgi:hypothetical protein